MSATTPHRCEALTTADRRCKCRAETCVMVAPDKEYLACRQHAKSTALFRPAVKVSECPPPVEWQAKTCPASFSIESLERLYIIGYNRHG